MKASTSALGVAAPSAVLDGDVSSAVPTRRSAQRDAVYLWIAIGMCVTAFAGFSITYFGPLFRAEYPQVSPLVHVHGWSYFAWYLLLPAQAGLIRIRRLAVHRRIGLATLGLGAVMIVVGLIVSTVRVAEAVGPDPDPFWSLMGLPIFSIWVLFTVFYVAAMVMRRRGADHKRLILLASAAALAAATFRLVVRFTDFTPTTALIGCLAPVLFLVVAMVHDLRQGRGVHRAYAWGVPAIVVLIWGAFALATTPAGQVPMEAVAWVGRLLLPLY